MSKTMHVGNGADVAKVVPIASPAQRAGLIRRAYELGHTDPTERSSHDLRRWINERERDRTARERLVQLAKDNGHPNPARRNSRELIVWLRRRA